MRSRLIPSARRFSRRGWIFLLGSAPLITQAVASNTDQPAVKAAATGLDKAVQDVQKVSERLSRLEVPMNVEPAFAFKA